MTAESQTWPVEDEPPARPLAPKAPPRIILNAMDWSGEGSFLKRLTLRRWARTTTRAATALERMGAQADYDEYLLEQLSTSDGSPIEPLLAKLSADQFDALRVEAEGDSTVGEATAAS